MIVCSCNVISSNAVQQTIQNCNGCCSISEVYGNLGCQPKCGRCARTISEMIKASAAPLQHDVGGGNAFAQQEPLPELACA